MTRPYDLQAEQRREPLGLGEPRPRLSWRLESDRQGAARDAGMRIPTDLSVVGFDDLPVTALTDPPLTTVHQPLVEMAMAATELALALGRGENPPQLGLELATTLTVRKSTARPRSSDGQ